MLFVNYSLIAQPNNLKSTTIETIKGKTFFIHTVDKGQTLYGISKIYNVSVDEILEHNPDASTGLKKGMTLKIPSKVVQNQDVQIVKPTTTKDSIVEHVVKQGETLYSIARFYNITIDQIKSKNPTLKEQLSVGDKIAIPLLKKPEQTIKNSDIVEKINQGVPVEKEIVDTVKKGVEVSAVKVSKSFRGYYEVALMIPFYLAESENAISDNIKNLKELDAVKSYSFIQFYESFLIALKQFESKGIKITLKVYDVENDTNKLNKLLNSTDFSNVDLIIGPFFTNTFKTASRWAMQNQVFIVNPFSSRNDLFKNNPFTIKITPSVQEEAAKIAQYCNSVYPKANILVLHNASESEKKMLTALKQQFTLLNSKIQLKEILYSENGINGVQEKIDDTHENILITLFTKEALVTNFIRRLYELKHDNVTLFGVVEWMDYDNIETDYLQYLKLHYYNTYFVDYKDENVINFVEKFRTEYNTEPQLNKYAFQGYDICTYFVGALIQYGYSWNEKINEFHPTLISSKIKLNRKDENSGYENSEIQIFKLEDYKFVRAE